MSSAVLIAGMAVTAVPGWSQVSRFAPNVPTTQQPAQQESPYAGKVVEEIVARVNDQAISKSDYDRAQQELDQEGRQQGWSQTQLMQQKRDLLRSLIDKQLLLSRGKELDIDSSTQVIKRLDDIRKQNHLDSMEALQKAAESQGVSFEDFKAQIRDSIITSSVISQEVGRHIQISPAEAQAYYSTHQSEFEKPEQVNLSEILIPTANPDDATQVADAQKKADALEARLKAGEDFATLAKSDSGGTTAAQGGELGNYKRGELAKLWEDQTFGLKEGQITNPIRSKQGIVILKVTQHTPGGLQPLKDVEDQIDEQLGYTKMEPALRVYLTKLREDAYIDLKPGYVDSGASPNEQKPVYSAYAPPTKKKKKVGRTRFRQVARRSSTPNQTAGSAPAPSGVPTLDKVNATPAANTKQASAKATTQKPGKKEKIRFGQAPRETLPAEDTKTQDASVTGDSQAAPTAGAPAAANQVAANNVPENAPGNVPANTSSRLQTNPDGTIVEQPEDTGKKEKTRFSARAALPKPKKDRSQAKVDPFAPPPMSVDEAAERKVQTAPLGLQGDTLHKKKPNPAKSGPKRRMTDEEKKQPAATGQPAATDNSGTPAPVPSAPAVPAAPAAPQAPANTGAAPQPQTQR
jgi:peptidyl-prolyl cis-trans isomerase SurA